MTDIDAEGVKTVSKSLGISSEWMKNKFGGIDLSHTMIAAMVSLLFF